jgi:hypothetical protein
VQSVAASKGTCRVTENFYSKRLNSEVAMATAGGAQSPLLIISYATISSSFPKWDAWQADCDDKGSLREKVGTGYMDEPDLCMLGAEHRRGQSDVGHPFFPPNVPLVVYVIHVAQVDSELYATQPQGFTGLQVLPGNGSTGTIAAPPSPGPTPPTAGSGTSATVRPPSRATKFPDACIIDRYELAPRAPGPFTVISELTDGGGALVPNSYHTLEMLVDQAYIGALRAGIGLSFPFYGSGLYGARTFGVHQAGNGANFIYQDAYSVANFEVTAGYAAFIPGRYASELRCNFWSCWPSPFFALGVVSATATGTFNALTSAYAGFELEAGPLTLDLMPFGIRRDTVLADGYFVGSAVPTGTAAAPTATQLHFAMALSLSLDADLFKVATLTLP